MYRPLLLLAGALLSGCMYAGSSFVCSTPISTSRPLLSVAALSGGSPRVGSPGMKFESAIHLNAWTDGTVSYFNGTYPWCKKLPAATLAELERSLSSLGPQASDRRALPIGLAASGAPVVLIEFGPTEDPGRPFAHAAFWSPASPGSEAAVPELDRVLCTLESVLGSGYRHQIGKHFGDFLEARGRSRPCAKVR